MANPILIKRSSVAAKVPATTDLQLGELAINTNDGKLFMLKNNGTASVVEIGGTPPPAGSDTQIQYNNGGATGGSANFVWVDSTKTLSVVNSITPTQKVSITPNLITLNSGGSITTGTTTSLVINPGDVTTSNTGGLLTVRGADTTAFAGGDVVIRGGNTTGANGGGNVSISSGTSGSGSAGTLSFKIGNTERLAIAANGAITTNGSFTASNGSLNLNGAAGTFRTFWMTTANAGRWNMHVDNVAESGSDAGSNLNVVAVGDSGTQTAVYSITRATAVVDFKKTPTLNGVALASTASPTFTGTVTAPLMKVGVNAAVAAAGTTQATGTALSTSVNVVTSGTGGVRLPTAEPGLMITVINTLGTAINVYPATGGQIDTQGANVAFPLGTTAKLQFVAVSATQWYALNGVYA